MLLAVLLLPAAALSRSRTDYPQLDAAGFSRQFGTATVVTDMFIRAGGGFEPGRRAYLQIDLNTSLPDSHGSMPRAVVINGFVTAALPPGLEPDGEPRLMFFDRTKDRYEYLYSKTYPRLERFDGLSSAIDDTTSGNPAQMLLGLDAIVGVLNPEVFLTPPSDARLIGRDQDYAITGVSWLIPCNVMFNELVGLFDPNTGIGTTPLSWFMPEG